MKHLEEYRNADIAARYLDDIHKVVTRPWSIMEICGGQTHSLVRNGIIELLPQSINMVHGPGCPVCVTPVAIIDKAIHLSRMSRVVLCSFGDMLRVPGTRESLLSAKAAGADVRLVYSPLDVVQLAKKSPGSKFVFLAAGFETTAPANALALIQAEKLGLDNFYVLSAQVLVPPAMELLLSDADTQVDGFLAAGHVCAITGYMAYLPLARQHQVPIVITGFEVLDLLLGILHCVRQLEHGEAEVANQYARVVKPNGNSQAREWMARVFEVSDREWRGIGTIPQSGLEPSIKYRRFDANFAFAMANVPAETSHSCIAGQILKGMKKPGDCASFRKECTPLHPLGAPMVSSEGACAAYFNYAKISS
ncbi:MAG: hydrogenase formation protein HypD [Cyclobacteriaceae bacterium]|nr:hydrogenase formation protein HypD [Cyclobacteriaceae bacterium]